LCCFFFVITTIADVRTYQIKGLTASEIAGIREYFSRLDIDSDETISLEEVEIFYTKRKLAKLEEYKAMIKDKIENFPAGKQRWLKMLERREESLEVEYQECLTLFMSLDIDNSGSVSWQEFLNHEAKRIMNKDNQVNSLMF